LLKTKKKEETCQTNEQKVEEINHTETENPHCHSETHCKKAETEETCKSSEQKVDEINCPSKTENTHCHTEKHCEGTEKEEPCQRRKVEDTNCTPNTEAHCHNEKPCKAAETEPTVNSSDTEKSTVNLETDVAVAKKPKCCKHSHKKTTHEMNLTERIDVENDGDKNLERMRKTTQKVESNQVQNKEKKGGCTNCLVF